MIRRIAAFALRQPAFMGLLTLIFVGAGIGAFLSLPIEAFPDVTDTQVTVITLFPGHAPEETEKQVTIPLETALSGMPHSVRIFSHTQFGLSYIIITFDDAVDAYFARSQAIERLRGVELPPGVEAELAPLSTPIGEIYRYRLTGGDPTGLRSTQEWTVARYLKTTPGVAEVVSLGGLIKQYQVNIDLGRMKARGISLTQILTALGRGNANAGGSTIEHGEQQYLIRGIGLLRSSEDIDDIVVAERSGTPVLMRDVARVGISGVPRQGITGQDEDDDIVSGIVMMRKGENPSEVLAAIHERVRTLNGSLLPAGVHVVPFYDRTMMIQATLRTVFKNLVEGALLVGAVLFLFLGDLRAAAIVALLIPLSLLATFIGLRLRGLPANLLSLGALDFGIIVDGAVIIVENVFRLLSGPRKDGRPAAADETILDAVEQVGRPTLFSMLIIIIAHIPIFVLQRQEGRIFAPMAYTVISALAGSLLFSMTLIPLLCARLLAGAREGPNRLTEACEKIYRPILDGALRRPQIVLAWALGGLLACLFLVAPRLGTEFLPELNEGGIWVNVTVPPGISLSEVTRLCGRIRSQLRHFPEVETVISKAGRPEDGTDPKQINMTEYMVNLKPQAEWRAGLSKEKLLSEMNHALEALPGVEPSFSQPIRDNILESISQIDGQIVVKIFGHDSTLLHEKAQEVLSVIDGVPGVARAFIDRAGRVPQLLIEIERGRAARYGLNVSDVEDVIETALGGKVATEIWEGDRRFGVVVRLPEEQRRSIDAIRNILVDTPAGPRVPLEQVASVKIGSGGMNISRELGMRVAAIGIFKGERDMGSLVAEMRRLVSEKVRLPAGYFITWGGEFENQERAMRRLRLIVPVVLFLIFVLLFDNFQSVRGAVVILATIPFALVGGILALWLTGTPLTVSAAIGFIALSGQAVLNGVVMASRFKQLRVRGVGLREAVSEGSAARLRAVLMTGLLAMLGFLPMVLSHGLGSEVQKPLALVVIGGLVSAIPLTLIVLPALYYLVYRITEARGWGRNEPPRKDAASA